MHLNKKKRIDNFKYGQYLWYTLAGSLSVPWIKVAEINKPNFFPFKLVTLGFIYLKWKSKSVHEPTPYLKKAHKKTLLYIPYEDH